MPPSDRLSGALSIASTVVGIASNLQGMGMFKGGGGGFDFGSVGDLGINWDFGDAIGQTQSFWNAPPLIPDLG